MLAFLGIILSADQSGATLKFSQISKLIARLRSININYGAKFGKFMDGIAKAFDGQEQGADIEENMRIYKRKITMMSLFGNGNKAKFNVYAQNLFLIGTMRKNYEQALINKKFGELEMMGNLNDTKRVLQSLTQVTQRAAIDNPLTMKGLMAELKFWIYLVSWVIKFYIYFKIHNIRERKDISLGVIKFINIARKVHFLLFNLTIIDIFFTGTRSLFHVEVTKLISLQIFTTGIIFILLTFDLIEIAWISGHVLYRAGKELEDQKKQAEE